MTHPSLIERITRSLAFMLRHRPERFDLDVDAYGYADLDEVVRALTERLGESIERDDVEDAIEAGDRVRYEIVGDTIRALYGHSIPVEPGPDTEPPEELFVGLPTRDVDRVLKHGLRSGRRSYLHLALTPDDARESGRRTAREYTIMTVKALDAWEEGVEFYDRKSLFLSEAIPAEMIEVGDDFDDGEDPVRRGERPSDGPRGRARRRRGRGDRDRDEEPRRDEPRERSSSRGASERGDAEHAGSARGGPERGGRTREDEGRVRERTRERRPRDEDRPRSTARAREDGGDDRGRRVTRTSARDATDERSREPRSSDRDRERRDPRTSPAARGSKPSPKREAPVRDEPKDADDGGFGLGVFETKPKKRQSKPARSSSNDDSGSRDKQAPRASEPVAEKDGARQNGDQPDDGDAFGAGLL